MKPILAAILMPHVRQYVADIPGELRKPQNAALLVQQSLNHTNISHGLR